MTLLVVMTKNAKYRGFILNAFVSVKHQKRKWFCTECKKRRYLQKGISKMVSKM